MSKNVIQVDHLNVSYYGKEVIQDISFTWQTGKLIGILGPNGAGKSTLMKAMLGLIPRDRGTIRIGNEPIKNVRKKIAYVPQRSMIDWDFPILVKDTVLLGTYPNLPLFRRPKKKDKEWALDCLQQVGMEAYKNNQISELSGGQQQRVFLARALAQQAEYFFLDEPFVGIDVSSEETIIAVLKQLRDQGKTVFVVHHDLDKVESYFDGLIIMNKKLIGTGPVTEVFKPEFMQKAYHMPFTSLDHVGAGV